MTAVLYLFAGVGVVASLVFLYRQLAPGESLDLPTELGAPPATAASDEAANPVARPRRHASPEVLAAHLSSPVLHGNRIELLENGDRIFPPMLDAIRGAQETINFLTFIYWEGEIADRFAEELARAARRGVEVRVLLDALGSSKMRDSLCDTMRDAGCRLEQFHPLRSHKLHHYNNRTHRKVLVVDGRVGFTGGVGVAREWTGDAQDPHHWRDNHFRVTGPAVRSLQGAFAENWREASNEVLDRPCMFPPLGREGGATVVPFQSSPGGSVSPVAFSYWYALRSARRRVTITSPYFLPSSDLFDELRRAADRGVEVLVLTPGSNNDYEAVHRATQTYYEDIMEAGIQLYTHDPTMIHVKSLTVDTEWSIVGSANFDNRSFELNYEVCLAVFDEDFTRALEASFERDLLRSTRVTADVVEDMGVVRKVANSAALALKPQL